MSRVVCLGEIMLRLTAPLHHRAVDAPFFDRCYGGAEANVAVQLAGLGVSCSFISRLPENELGDGCIESLRARGVETDGIQRGGARLGLYFVTPGHGARPTSVLYDRAGSAMCDARPGMFNWEDIFAGASWFHCSGITPALGEGPAALCEEACSMAQRCGVTVSFDINYRSKLWCHQSAAAVLQPLMKHVNLCICGEDEAVSLLGATAGNVAVSLSEKYGFSHIAMTSRSGETADHTHLFGSLYTANCSFVSREYELAIIDRIGTGDAFTGALIFSILRGDTPQTTIDFATAACAWKHSIPGDWNRASVGELEALAAGPKRMGVLR